MSRFRAALIHVLISVSILLSVLGLMLGVWYPQPYFNLMQARELLFIVFGVDVVLGPLLTLVVFKAGKKGLKLDLALIGVAQMAALAYGMFVVLSARPVYVVFNVDRFDVVSANAVFNPEKAPFPEYRSLPWTGPKVVGAVKFPAQQLDAIMQAMGGKDIQNMPQQYRPYARFVGTVLQKSKPLSDLYKRQPTRHAEINAVLAKHGYRAEQVRCLMLLSDKYEMVMLIDAKTAQPLDALDMPLY